MKFVFLARALLTSVKVLVHAGIVSVEGGFPYGGSQERVEGFEDGSTIRDINCV